MDSSTTSEEASTPDYRDSLANERTFLAWIRTGLSLDGFGFAVLQLFPDFGSSVTRTVTGIALILLGTVVIGASFWQWRANERAIHERTELASSCCLWHSPEVFPW